MQRRTFLAVLIGSVLAGLPFAEVSGAENTVVLLATIRPRGALTADANSTLSPMLIAVKDSGGVLKGTDSVGRAVISIPQQNVAQFKASAVVQDVSEDIPMDTRPVSQLKLSYATGKKPTDADLKALGLKHVGSDYQKGNFIMVEPLNGKIDAALASKLGKDKSIRFVTPSVNIQAIPLPKKEAKPNAKDVSGNGRAKPPARSAIAAKLPPVVQGPPTDDPLWPELWGMVVIHAPTAWAKVHDSNAVVAVIDTGIDYNHQDLVGNIWSNSQNQHGYNFVDDNPDPMDRNGHGTHCSGTIGAVGNNHIGVVGVNWHIKVMGVRWLDANGSGQVVNAIKAIDYAVDNGANVLSNSWYWYEDDPDLQEAIKRASDKGILFVVAASNFSNDNDNPGAVGRYPSSYPIDNLIAVAAIDQNEQLATFSNYGRHTVHIAAPGVSIESTVLNNGYDGTYSGTSMATPHVAGAAALLLTDPRFTGASASTVKTAILNHARKVPGLQGRCVSEGILDMSFFP